MSRKYEIVNVGGVNRVRALRSWVVQGRQVNVGDIGGAVFDERTLSQDGDAWIFSGRFDNPLIRVGGDSVVNIGDVVPARFPFINIFGTSSLDANFNVSFAIGNLSSARPLTPAMMEQGSFSGTVGTKIVKTSSAQGIRKKDKMFTGGASFTIPAPAEGFSVRAIAVDENDICTYVSNYVTGSITVPAGAHSYVHLIVAKTPTATTVPSDVTAAALTFQDHAEATINIVDSHITLTGGSAGYVMIGASGEYQGNVTNIEGSTVQVNRTEGNQILNLFCDLINTTATVNMGASNTAVQGVYKNVKNLVWGVIDWSRVPFSRTCIQATDCNNFVMDGVNISTTAIDAANAIGTPYKFIRCNMNKAFIISQPKINNTYEDINFDLADDDLYKLTVGSLSSLASSNVNGMYRLQGGNGIYIGALVESYESVKGLNLASAANIAKTHDTTIYADAYLKGLISFDGTNVFGNAVKKPKTRTIDVARVAVQGTFNGASVGHAITGIVASASACVIPSPINLRTAKGVTVSGLTGDLRWVTFTTNARSVITYASQFLTNGDLAITEHPQCYIGFSRLGSTPIKPEDLAGVTITTYNGSKVINTKATAMTIAGNVRVEENAVLKDTSIEGTGYFGGESVTEAPATATAPQSVNGYAYMKDNAVFSPNSLSSNSISITRLHGEGNARMTGGVASVNVNLFMKDNAVYAGQLYGTCDIRIQDGASVPANLGVTAASYGKLTMKGKASLGNNITIKGDITLCDNYRNTAVKIYSGKRVIDSQDAPQYDNNVKTQYDF